MTSVEATAANLTPRQRELCDLLCAGHTVPASHASHRLAMSV